MIELARGVLPNIEPPSTLARTSWKNSPFQSLRTTGLRVNSLIETSHTTYLVELIALTFSRSSVSTNLAPGRCNSMV